MIFVDTSFWVASSNIRDARHHEAARLLRANSAQTLTTTNHVLGETWNILRRRRGHREACLFLDWMEASERTELVFTSQETEERAWLWLRQHDERVYSFVDAASFAVMREQGIHEALAFDGDFSAAGFVELRA